MKLLLLVPKLGTALSALLEIYDLSAQETGPDYEFILQEWYYMAPHVVQKHAPDLTLEFKNLHKVTYVARHTKDDFEIVPQLGHGG